jgi:DsbC/DsbD-like thiol-disulfide interchange protein
MISHSPHLWLRLAACALVLCLGARATLRADDASPWDGDERSSARLISGARAAGADAALLRAGIEIRLAPGWHTYWRYPGDAGVPPKIDLAGSDNVAAVDVLWPAPQRLPEDGLTAIGYDKSFVLPLRVVPRDRTAPAVLRLKLDYAVCEKLCVPAQARAELALAGGSPAEDAVLGAAESRVPKKRALGEGDTLAIRSVRREQGPAGPRAVVEIAAPAGAHVDLFAEGPNAQWSLPLPSPIAAGGDGSQRFAFDLDGAPPGEGYEGIQLTLTAVSGGDAIEVATRLD